MKKAVTYSVLALLVLTIGGVANAQPVSQKAGKYTLSLCYSQQGDWETPQSLRENGSTNLCTKQTEELIDKAIKGKKPNFAKDYVLVEFKYKKARYTSYEYIAVNPKTKMGYVFPFEVKNFGDGKLATVAPKTKFNANSDVLCIGGSHYDFVNSGLRYSLGSNDNTCWKFQGSRDGWDHSPLE